LVTVSQLRRRAQRGGLGEVVAMGGRMRLAPLDLPDSLQVRLQRMYPGAKYFAAQNVVNVPMPEGQSDAELVAWVNQLLTAIVPASVPAEVATEPPAESQPSR